MYDLRESNVAQFVKELNSYNWTSFYKSDMDVDRKTSIFYERINKALLQIPFEFMEMTITDKPWLTPKLKLLINKRYQAFHSKDWLLFHHFKTKIKKEIAKAKTAWLQKSTLTSNGLWKAVRDIRNKCHDSSLATLLRSFPPSSNAVNVINRSLCDHFSAASNWSSIIVNINIQR